MGVATTYEIFMKMFGDKSRLAKQVALRNIMNTRMTKGTLVRDLMICMIAFLMRWRSLESKGNPDPKGVHMAMKNSLGSSHNNKKKNSFKKSK
ncbi:hypothetical protein AAG906_041212 [Vitis piasezkii]